MALTVELLNLYMGRNYVLFLDSYDKKNQLFDCKRAEQNGRHNAAEGFSMPPAISTYFRNIC